ncbi:tigger transposable element-derived protein 6-like [Dermacentor andersoni]|uniref:tigger transposable element-derived protein 6-like n=1 Tax=Dermacentor andersoni TaxID=34620 RepID=UPI003B3B4E00
MAPTKRKAVSLDTKMDILQDSRRGFKVSALVKKYELAQSTISTILKTGSTTIVKAGAIGGHADQRKRVRDPLYADVEEALYQWFITTRAHNVPISGPILATKAKNFAFLLGRPNFEPGGGWIQRFKERHGIVYKNVVGEAASLDTEAKQQWLQTKLPSVLERYAEKDIYNCDETALFFQMLPSKTHALKGDRCPGGKHSKLRVTVLLCVSMDGSHRLKPFVIGRSKKPTCFKNQHIPVRYRSNKKARMTRDLFEEWLLEFDSLIEGQGRKVVLLLDNCSAHSVNPKLTSVELMFLPPNTTAGLQPLDAGVIANFKVLYRRHMLEWLILAIDRAAPGTSGHADGPPDLKISLLKAVRFVYGAWYEVKQSTIYNCFKKAGFVRQDEFPQPTETNTVEAADITEFWELVPTGDTGGASMEEFLTADSAASFCDEVTDEAIAEDVLSRQTAKLCDGGDGSSDSDNEIGSGSLTPTTMSTQSALSSIDSLIDFMHAKGLPPVFAQQLESMHTAVVKLKLPQKQVQISDYVGAPNP